MCTRGYIKKNSYAQGTFFAKSLQLQRMLGISIVIYTAKTVNYILANKVNFVKSVNSVNWHKT